MNIKKAAMMLTIMLITILSASSFYVLTGEAELEKNITVNSTVKDYEKLYGEGPYTDSSGSYYIRYTGEKSHRTEIDLYNADQTDSNGIPLGGYGVTKDSDGTIKIFGQEITSTYKMFSKRNGGTNTEITRVFVPSSIAIDGDKDLSTGTEAYKNNGIASNTFEGWSTDTEKDVIYHTGNILVTDDITSDSTSVDKKTANAQGMGITAIYDRTTKIRKSTYSHITTYVYLGDENVVRTTSDLVTLDSSQSYDSQYKGKVTNVFVSNDVNYPSGFFCHAASHNGLGTYINYLLIDDGESWFKNKMGIAVLAWNQPYLKITGNFKMPNEIYQGDNTDTINEIGLVSFLSRCGSLGNLPENFAVPEGVTNVNGMFFECQNLRGTIQLPSSAKYFKDVVDSSTQFLLNAGISAEPLENKNHAITLRIYKNSVADEFFTNNKMDNVDIEYIGAASSQSSTNAIAMIQETTNKIVIEDSTDEISITVNKVSQNEKISIEDETEYVTVTVNKKSTDESDEEGSATE